MSQLMLVNPRKRRAKRRKSPARKTRTITKYRYKSRPKRRVRRRRNPIRSTKMMPMIIDSFKNGAVGSLGAIAGSAINGILPIPVALQSGPMAPVVRALIGIGSGFAVSKFMNKNIGVQMAQGAVTVALHDTMKGFIQQAAPGLNLGAYDDMPYLGAYDDASDLGYYSSAPVSSFTESAESDGEEESESVDGWY